MIKKRLTVTKYGDMIEKTLGATFVFVTRPADYSDEKGFPGSEPKFWRYSHEKEKIPGQLGMAARAQPDSCPCDGAVIAARRPTRGDFCRG